MKKHNQKKNNPFKVNQIRSMKIKAKAQPFKGQLKNLKEILNKKVYSADEELKALGDVVRQAPKPQTTEEKSTPISAPSRNEMIEKYQTTEKNAEDALKKLETWNFEK